MSQSLTQAIEMMERAMNGSAAVYRAPLRTLIEAATLSVGQGELLESMGQTNKVLASRLTRAANALPLLIDSLNSAGDTADEDEPNDGYESLYNTASEVSTGLRKLLRELNGEAQA